MLKVEELADVLLRVAGWDDAKNRFVKAEGGYTRSKEVRRGDD